MSLPPPPTQSFQPCSPLLLLPPLEGLCGLVRLFFVGDVVPPYGGAQTRLRFVVVAHGACVLAVGALLFPPSLSFFFAGCGRMCASCTFSQAPLPFLSDHLSGFPPLPFCILPTTVPPPSPFIITHISLLSSAPSTSLQPPRPAFSDHLSLSPTANVPISWRIHLVIITYVCLCVCCCPRWVGCCGRRRSDGDRRHASCLPQRAASSRRPKLRRRSRRRVCKIGALCVVLRSSTLTIRIYAALVATYR